VRGPGERASEVGKSREKAGASGGGWGCSREAGGKPLKPERRREKHVTAVANRPRENGRSYARRRRVASSSFPARARRWLERNAQGTASKRHGLTRARGSTPGDATVGTRRYLPAASRLAEASPRNRRTVKQTAPSSRRLGSSISLHCSHMPSQLTASQ